MEGGKGEGEGESQVLEMEEKWEVKKELRW